MRSTSIPKPLNPCPAAQGGIYDGFEAWSENRHGIETTTWLKAAAHPQAAEQLEYERNAAYGIAPGGMVGPLGPVAGTPNPAQERSLGPYGAPASAEYPTRNAWVTPAWEREPNDGKIYPKREKGQYLERPEVEPARRTMLPSTFFSFFFCRLGWLVNRRHCRRRRCRPCINNISRSCLMKAECPR